MALKREVSKIDEVEERFRDLYSEQNGKFVLQPDLIEGIDNIPGLTSALEKERKSARDSAKALKQIQEKYGDLDPDEAKAALDLKRQHDEKKLLDSGEIDKLVSQRTESMKKDYEKQLKAAQTENETLRGQLSEILIDGGVKDAFPR